MKKLTIILLVSLFTGILVYSCKKKDEAGYSCVNNACKLVEEGREYLTLADCQASGCAKPAAPQSGAVQFNISGSTIGPAVFEATVSLAHSSADLANSIFFDEKTFYSNNNSLNAALPYNFEHKKADLQPANYYYKLSYIKYNKKTVKTEVFTVEPGKTTSFNFDL